jgi:hypothetical protein
MRDIQAMMATTEWGMQIGDEAATLPNQDSPIGYSCPVCGEVYSTVEEAEECRDQPFDDGSLKIGDIAVVPGAHSYYYLHSEGNPWLAFQPGDCSRYTPFFVVTAIHTDREKHRCIVTLATILSDRVYAGWTPANGDGHCEVFKLDGSPRNNIGHNDYWIERMPDLTKVVVPEQVKEEAAAMANLGISTRTLI